MVDSNFKSMMSDTVTQPDRLSLKGRNKVQALPPVPHHPKHVDVRIPSLQPMTRQSK
jgi:hypothetical protein